MQKTGELPELKKNRRPKTYLSKEEKEGIDKVWNETKREILVAIKRGSIP